MFFSLVWTRHNTELRKFNLMWFTKTNLQKQYTKQEVLASAVDCLTQRNAERFQ